MKYLLLTTLNCCFSLLLFSQGYTDVSVSSGVGFTHSAPSDAVDMPIGTGAVWFDYNNDDHIDLYVTQRIGANKFFENNGDGTFTEKAGTLGVADSSHDGAGAAAADINNDGYLDLFLANSDENVLYLNNQGTGFTDITATSGLASMGNARSTSASFGDYDNDGFLDIYVSHHVPVIGVTASTQDFLFRNNGDKTFTDVSSLLGVTHLMDPGFIAGWTDYDNDNDLDIILINDCPFNDDFENNGTQVFRNDGGTDPISNWTFTEVADAVVDADCSNGMGIGVGDYNRDGKFDIAYSNIGPGTLWENMSTHYELDTDADFSIQPNLHFSWGVSFLDYNNDGFQDISMAVGALISAGAGDDPTQECNFFENDGDGTFTEKASTLNLDDTDRTRTLVHCDYDNDGDLDLLMVNYAGAVRLLRNDVITTNNYSRIKLISKKSAPNGIGAKLKLTSNDGVIQHFEMRSGSNLGGGDEILAHFGLGLATSITEIEVKWPSGVISTLNNPSINSLLTIVEPAQYHFVCKSATGANNGSNWANAYVDLVDALNVVDNGDSIFIADGTYYPSSTSNMNSLFGIDKDVMIMGAFPSTGGGIPERNTSAMNTILSGFVGEQNSENVRAFRVLGITSSVSNCTIDGVKIIEGFADGVSADEMIASGLKCEGILHLKNVEFANNNATNSPNTVLVSGNGAELILENCTIDNPSNLHIAVSTQDNGKITIKTSSTLSGGM